MLLGQIKKNLDATGNQVKIISKSQVYYRRAKNLTFLVIDFANFFASLDFVKKSSRYHRGSLMAAIVFAVIFSVGVFALVSPISNM